MAVLLNIIFFSSYNTLFFEFVVRGVDNEVGLPLLKDSQDTPLIASRANFVKYPLSLLVKENVTYIKKIYLFHMM